MRRRYRAGVYAEERFRRGRSSWRRRTLPGLALRLAPFCAAYVAVAAMLGNFVWWFGAGLICGLTVGVGLWVWEQSPWDVLKWGVGAQGERWTEDALRTLESEDWSVLHDVDHGRGNDDHVVSGPNGVYLLETKALRGRITVEDGVLQTRSYDDAGNVTPWPRLAPRLRGRAKELASTAHRQLGARAWVQPVVVVWGDFPDRRVDADGVVYLQGDELVGWLRARPAARVELTVAMP